MPNQDIVHATVVATGTGSQDLGETIVKLPGKTKPYVTEVYDGSKHTINIANITAKWIDRFDDPRYYTGDTSS